MEGQETWDSDTGLRSWLGRVQSLGRGWDTGEGEVLGTIHKSREVHRRDCGSLSYASECRV